MPASSRHELIIWDYPHHDSTIMHSLGDYEVQKRGDCQTPDLHAGEAVQAKYGPERGKIQLENELVLQKVKEKLDFMASLK